MSADTMTHRERARKILNFEEADRPAIDLGATRMTGTTAWTYGALKQALGIDGGVTRVPYPDQEWGTWLA